MSDARARDLERRAAHDPEAASALVRERVRAGDGPWLPVLARDAGRWRRAGIAVRIDILTFVIGRAHHASGRSGNAYARLGALNAVAVDALGESDPFSLAAPRRRRYPLDVDPWPWIDPAAEAAANVTRINAGLATPREQARTRGVSAFHAVRGELKQLDRILGTP